MIPMHMANILPLIIGPVLSLMLKSMIKPMPLYVFKALVSSVIAMPTQGKVNLAYVDHHFGKDTTLRVGRQLYTPALGLMYDDLVDGARLMYKHGKLDVSASYGYWLGWCRYIPKQGKTLSRQLC